MEKQIEALLSQMTLEEKISLLAGIDLWRTVPVPRLGIPQIKVTDGPNGARGVGGSSGPTSVCTPVGAALAATWNVELVQRVGEVLGDETRAKGAHILLAPTVNIHRSPLAGRNFECYSEDPYLAGRMAVAYIQGVQSKGVGACIKHFVCNDSEYQRTSLSSDVGERALREIYLAPFRMAMREAKPWSIMSAYNKLNGVWCSENDYLLKEILKGEWGFDGIVMSDWMGTYTPRAAFNGLDLEMPGPTRWMGEHVHQALEAGETSLADIDDSARRLLRTFFRVGVMDAQQMQPEQAVDKPEHRQVVLEAASEAIVLLKNSGDILPLEAKKVRSVAVIGANARWAQVMGGGSSSVTPHYIVSPLDGILKAAGSGFEVAYALGCPIHRSLPLLEMPWLTAKDGRVGLDVQYYANVELQGVPTGSWFTDRSDIFWADDYLVGVETGSFSARLTGSLAVAETGLYTFGLEGNGVFRLSIGGQVVVNHWSQQIGDTSPWEGGELQGQVELAAGKSYEFVLEYAWQGKNPWRSLRIGCLPPIHADPLQQAVDLAAKSDVAVIFAGLTPEWESEGFDRPDMQLVQGQDALIERVAAANPNTIVVLNVGSPVAMPWLEKVRGLIQMWYLGQESGNAIAAVLFGKVNPSGKLPTTFPRRLEDTPAYINYPGENGHVLYGEGLFVGYRYYDKKDVEPLFPFGFGLSYTQFAYQNLKISSAVYSSGDAIQISLEVTNTGSRAGKEIVQLYLRDPEARLVRPPKELKAFAKVALQPGETRTVTFNLDQEALAFYDDAVKAWMVEDGVFEVLVGSSSRHIHLTGSFEWKGSLVFSQAKLAAPRLHTQLPVKVLIEDEAAKKVISAHLPGILEHPQLRLAYDLTLEQLAGFVPEYLTPAVLKAIGADLAKIP
ncbi:MAG: glycoside hydrolase family 3 C-terminal domain-containing protein [Anaerolineales bacterium]|nr:glycoside hydrolase family 3 C-terminal domain-containing protein [Anaerolineales bacterium]